MTWMDLEDVMLHGVSQKGKERHRMIFFLCKTNETQQRNKKRIKGHTTGEESHGIGWVGSKWCEGSYRERGEDTDDGGHLEVYGEPSLVLW